MEINITDGVYYPLLIRGRSGEEFLKITDSGDFIVKGVLAENNQEVVEVFKEYLKQQDYQEWADLWNQIAELQDKVNLLENTLDVYGLPLPYERPRSNDHAVDEETGDWLPF